MRVLLGAVVAATLALAPAAGGANRTTYEDDRAEESGAPDVQRVVVTNDDRGRITFRVEIPTHPTLTQDMRIRIWFSDRHPATGLTTSGADGFVLLDGFLLGVGNAVLYRCQDSVCVPTAESRNGSLGFSYAGGVTVRATTEALGIRLDVSPRLDFFVEAGAGYVYDPVTRLFDLSGVRRDRAPSADGSWWTYDVRIGPVALVARAPTTTPTAARAGRPLTVRMHVTAADTGRTIRSGVVTCTARIGSSRLRPLSTGFRSRRATCAYRLPTRAKGKTLRGSVSVELAGKTVTRSFVRPIR